MKNNLEQLLNSLIKRGRVPFGIEKIEEINYVKHNGTLCWYLWGGSYQRWKSIRELVSIESNLWQFVCENGMVKKSIINREYFNTLGGCRITFRDENMAFWLIESSLKDESELEDFLLSNIVIKYEK